MSLHPAVLKGIKKATWSLEEAAYFVHNLDPVRPTTHRDPESHSAPSKTYYWLKKELEKNPWFKPVATGNKGEPRFSPGTILRHLKDFRKAYSKIVYKAYVQQGAIAARSHANAEAREVYRKAAELMWLQQPKLPISQVAEVLTELPAHLQNLVVPSFTIHTIRKYLKGLKEQPPGRPPKGAVEAVEIDWPSIVEKIDPEN